MTPNPGSLIKNSKLRGEWVELRFMTRAAEQGVMVSKPWGDSAPYDFMIENNGRVLRVQVKSTMRIIRGCYRCHVPYNRGQGSPQRLMDFVAAYVIPEDLWYILPARVATCLQGHISLSPHRPGHKCEPYLEAWHLLLGR